MSSVWEDPSAMRTGEDCYFLKGVGTRAIVLDRPKQLNALNLPMVRRITPALKTWDKHSDQVSAVVVMGNGKGFCAGGDVVTLWKHKKQPEGNAERERLGLGDTASFFREEYQLNHLIGSLGVPYVAVLDGFTMGGGVGLSVHGRFRVATENTLFAMPETAIGFFPDVGGSYFLPRLAGEMGMYLALTGARLKGSDALHAGIATHYIPTDGLSSLYEHLNRFQPADDSTMMVEDALAAVHSRTPLPEFTMAPHLDTIDECFRHDTVEDIIEALESHPTDRDFCDKTLKLLKHMSPLSLKITHEQLRRGVRLSFEECFCMEYRMSQAFMEGHDFFEGVRALLVDGDKQPKWQHDSLAAVTREEVLAYFQPFEDESRELRLGHLSGKLLAPVIETERAARVQYAINNAVLEMIKTELPPPESASVDLLDRVDGLAQLFNRFADLPFYETVHSQARKLAEEKRVVTQEDLAQQHAELVSIIDPTTGVRPGESATAALNRIVRRVGPDDGSFGPLLCTPNKWAADLLSSLRIQSGDVNPASFENMDMGADPELQLHPSQRPSSSRDTSKPDEQRNGCLATLIAAVQGEIGLPLAPTAYVVPKTQ